MQDPQRLLHWYVSDNNGNNFDFNSLNLTQAYFDNLDGVYIIWYPSNSPIFPVTTVYAGQGRINNRLYVHRDDNRIQLYADRNLCVTWATTTARDRDGIEAYLHQRLNPLVRERTPTDRPISVNLPW